MKQRVLYCLIIFISLSITRPLYGQSILSRTISVEVNRQRLDHVLEIISNKGNFYFSYNSAIVKRDSLVTLSVSSKSIKDILGLLFNNTYEFRESGNYIIIRKAPIRLTMVTKKATEENRIFSVSGFVYDEQSGTPINEASIYEKKILASALTNSDGYFKIRLKSGRASFTELTISKEDYADTTVVIESSHSQEVTITMMPIAREGEVTVITPLDYSTPDSLQHPPPPLPLLTLNPVDSIRVERTGMGRLLVSSKQKVQSLNLNKFFTTRPFQVSLTPGLSTYGRMAPQVIGNFSLNILGGYTAGVNGVEIGGLFNLDKKEVKYVQAAGLFNVAGGAVTGVQLAGINNTVLDSVRALQVAGVNNVVRRKFNGVQVSGVYNHVSDSVMGVQLSGVANFANKKVSGAQVAGVVNVSWRETGGAQIGLINYTRRLRGVQVGLINVADTSEGYSIGLINIVLKGYHKLSVSVNEVLNVNAAFKTGSARLYSIFLSGLNVSDSDRVYSFGYGLGTEIPLNKRQTFFINPEITSQYLYIGSWSYVNILSKLCVNVNFRINKYISLFAGPSFGVYYSDQDMAFTTYRSPAAPVPYQTYTISDRLKGWFGWNTGINFF